MAAAARDLLESVDWPGSYRPACPSCRSPLAGLRELYARRVGVRQPVVVALGWPCGCPVDEQAAALQAGAVAPTPLPEDADEAAPRPPTSGTDGRRGR